MVQVAEARLPLKTRREVLEQGCCPAPALLDHDQFGEALHVFHALGDKTRVQIVSLLAVQPEPLCVCHIEAAFTLSQPTISHHLKVLREAGLVAAKRRGVWMYYTLNRQRFGALRDFIDAVGDREDRTNGRVGGHEMTTVDKARIKKAVSERYSAKAKERLKPQLLELSLAGVSACCGPSVGTAGQAVEKAVAKGYSAGELANLPETVTEISLGCGNPVALAQIKEGDVVLDLGSGGGLDCFLAAQRAGTTGRVIGLDMNQDMLALARENAEKVGATNVEFREGEMESMPLPDASVDLIISNCVINLSPDKDAVFREAFRVLRPGGRFCVSDIVVEGEMPEELRNNLDEWAACAAGALERGEFIAKLDAAGFSGAQMLSEHLSRRGVENGWDKGQLLSAVIIAVKP